MVRLTEVEKERAGRAVAARMREMRTSSVDVARVARVDPRTVRALVQGTRWPTAASRSNIARALGWRPGDIVRHAQGDPELQSFTVRELLDELCRRVDEWDRAISRQQVALDEQH